MKFTTRIYDFKKPKESLNNKIAYSAWGIALITLLGINQDILPSNFFTNTVIFICVFVPPIIGFSAMFTKEEHKKKLIGILQINTEKIDWSGQEIIWDDIEDITISFFDYSGRFIYKGSGNYENNQSNGLDNKIKIILKDSSKYEGNILIESKQSAKDLKDVLWCVIKENKISVQNAKQMINPENYKECQEIKKYCN